MFERCKAQDSVIEVSFNNQGQPVHSLLAVHCSYARSLATILMRTCKDQIWYRAEAVRGCVKVYCFRTSCKVKAIESPLKPTFLSRGAAVTHFGMTGVRQSIYSTKIDRVLTAVNLAEYFEGPCTCERLEVSFSGVR